MPRSIFLHSLPRALCLGLSCASIIWAPATALAQTSLDLLNLSPRGNTQTQDQNTQNQGGQSPQGGQDGGQNQSGTGNTSTGLSIPTVNFPAPLLYGAGVGTKAVPASATSATPQMPLPPLPIDPASSPTPVVFGSQMFSGRFSMESFSGFNPNYQITQGDRINVQLWGAFNLNASQPVDAQGNIFIPNIGPVHVLGMRNSELNAQVQNQIKRVFRSNVGVYASLDTAQLVKVFVTGFVRAPGLYGGLSSNSVLYYLDKAGGIDPNRGSFLNVQVMRGSRELRQIDLYDFLLKGQSPELQLHDGDSIVVQSRQHTVQVSGEVLNPYIFEFTTPTISASELLELARPTPAATHMSIVRDIGAQKRSEYHSLSMAANTTIQDGDQVTLTADKYPGTILVRVEGANLGERTLVLPYGARLNDAIERIHPAPQANMDALELFRKSVAARQQIMLDTSLRSLETYALTARSATSEEAALRTREAESIMKYVDLARNVQPRGQVILSSNKQAAGQTLLEDGDVLRLPETSNLVLVNGEVIFPNSLIYNPRESVADYVAQAGGLTQNADEAKILVLHQDGSVATTDAKAASQPIRPGDAIVALPKITSKNIEVTRGITQIIYQIAVAAKVALGL